MGEQLPGRGRCRPEITAPRSVALGAVSKATVLGAVDARCPHSSALAGIWSPAGEEAPPAALSGGAQAFQGTSHHPICLAKGLEWQFPGSGPSWV